MSYSANPPPPLTSPVSHPCTSVVGRYLRKRRSCDQDKEAPLSQASTLNGHYHGASATGTDRSEIGPYLGGHWATYTVPATNSASPMHFRGRAISPKAPLRRTEGPHKGQALKRPSGSGSGRSEHWNVNTLTFLAHSAKATPVPTFPANAAPTRGAPATRSPRQPHRANLAAPTPQPNPLPRTNPLHPRFETPPPNN